MNVFDKALKRFNKVAKNRGSLIGHPVGTVRFKNGKLWSGNYITCDGVREPGFGQVSELRRQMSGESSVSSGSVGMVSFPDNRKITTGLESVQ